MANPHRPIMIEAIKAGKTYPPDVPALADISFVVERGEMFFLTGVSGAGKTTLLKLLCRVEQPSRGVIEIDGRDLARFTPAEVQALRRRIGVAWQDFRLLPDWSVTRNVALALEVCYQPREIVERRVGELLERLQLWEKRDTEVRDLSRGEQQRVAIARAVAGRPGLILADEPTGNLDPENIALVMDLFRECNRDGATLIIATHDSSLYEDTGCRVLRLRHGRQSRGRAAPAEHGPAQELAVPDTAANAEGEEQ